MNTKNIIVLMFLIFFAAGVSAQVYHYSGGNITDSAGIITFKKPVRMMNINQDFGYGSSLWNFRLENDEGTIVWRANNDRDLMTYDDDGHIWNLTGTLQVNGVPISAGGGDAYLTNRQTFTKRNIFSDTLKADALSLMEQVRIADWFQVTGDVISDLNFLKGSSTSIGTISTDSLAIITDNTKRIVIRPTGQSYFYESANFTDSLNVTGAILKADSINLSKDINMLSDTSGIIWKSGGLSEIYQIQSPASILAFKQNEFDFFTKKNTQLMYLDSLNGMTLNYGIYTGNGSGLTSVDAITLKGQDTTHFARTDTSTTENIKGAWTFWNIVRCIGIVTFDVSPVFNSLVNFANGINVTGNGTFSGNVTADTLKGKGQKITGIKRTIVLPTSAIFSPADATTYYGGSYVGGFENTEITQRVYVGMTDTVRAVYIGVYKGTGGTTENVAYYVRVNGTTDYTITTTGQLTSGFGVDVISNTAMAVPLAAGDYFTIKMVCPTWATNPTNCRTSITLLMD